MYSLTNAVSLTGNLGRDVEIKTLDSGSKVGNTSIATNLYYKDEKGEKIKETTWHNLVAWNKTAELMEQILKKGSLVQIQGMIQNDTYKTQNGETRTATKVKVHSFLVLSAKEQAMPF